MESAGDYLRFDSAPGSVFQHLASNAPPMIHFPDPEMLLRIAKALESLDAKTLTKREQIAAMAMQGMLSASEEATFIKKDVEYYCRYADALLAELGKEEK